MRCLQRVWCCWGEEQTRVTHTATPSTPWMWRTLASTAAWRATSSGRLSTSPTWRSTEVSQPRIEVRTSLIIPLIKLSHSLYPSSMQWSSLPACQQYDSGNNELTTNLSINLKSWIFHHNLFHRELELLVLFGWRCTVGCWRDDDGWSLHSE